VLLALSRLLAHVLNFLLPNLPNSDLRCL